MKTPEPLSPELDALLAPHRRVLPLAPSVEARALARAARAGARAEEAPQPGAGFALARPWWVFAAAAGAVVALGAAAYAAHAWRSTAASPVAVRAPVAVPSLTPPRLSPHGAVGVMAEATAPAANATPESSPPRRRIVRKASAPTLRPTNEELQLLRSARQHVTRGDFAGALSAVAEHDRRFRHGSLVEEREALRVKSLAGLGRQEDAQRAASEFHARFPRSVLLPTFERMREAER